MFQNISFEQAIDGIFHSITGTLFNALSTCSGFSTLYSFFHLPYAAYNKSTFTAKVNGYSTLARTVGGTLIAASSIITSPILTIPDCVRFQLAMYLSPLSTNILGYNNINKYLPPSDATPAFWQNRATYTTQKLFTDILIQGCFGR